MPTWNLYQRPWPIAAWFDTPRLPARKERSQGILDTIAGGGFDLVCLQEAFHGPTRRALARRFPCAVRKLTHPLCLRLHSALMILSRLPIRSHDGRIFHDDSAGGCDEDAWVDKGVMTAEIDLPDGPLRVFNTHLQSGAHADIRAAQLAIAAKFAARFSGPAVFAGDLNLESAEESSLEPLFRLGFRAAETGVTKPDGGHRFDRLLHRDLEVHDLSIVQSRWSDHFGISATLANVLVSGIRAPLR